MRPLKGRALVLNATFEPINVCTVRRATVLVLKDKAEILAHGHGVLHSEHLTLGRPEVIRLTSYAPIPRDPARRRITRKAVLARDGFRCQYCGDERGVLTLDHVIPRSRGGESIWENVTTSCAPCNRRKGDRTPSEARMHPRLKPAPPGPQVFIQIACPSLPNAWREYVEPWARRHLPLAQPAAAELAA